MIVNLVDNLIIAAIFSIQLNVNRGYDLSAILYKTFTFYLHCNNVVRESDWLIIIPLAN